MRNVNGSTEGRPLVDDITRWVFDPDDYCFTMLLDASRSNPGFGFDGRGHGFHLAYLRAARPASDTAEEYP
jgi:hypothetical protein